MKGILEKREDGWYVKWSDTHSFMYGTHWMWTPLHQSEVIDETKLKDGDSVEFETVIIGFDKVNFAPQQFTTLIKTKAKQIMMNNEKTLYELQKDLIELYESQIMDLTIMSKIELGDDVISEVKRLKQLINEKQS